MRRKTFARLNLIFVIMALILTTMTLARIPALKKDHDAIVAQVVLKKITQGNETEIRLTKILSYKRYEQTPWKEVAQDSELNVNWVNKVLNLGEGDEILVSILGCPAEYGSCAGDYGYGQAGWIMQSDKLIAKKDESTINQNYAKLALFGIITLVLFAIVLIIKRKARKKSKKGSLLLPAYFAFILVLANVVIGVPANPNNYQITQPDGTFVSARDFGDEFISWTETEDGFTIQKDVDNWWKFSKPEQEVYDKKSVQKLVASNAKAGKDDPSAIGIKKHLIPEISEKAKEKKKHFEPQEEGRYHIGGGGSSGNGAYYDPVNGTQKIIILLIQFPDKSGTTTPLNISNRIFNTSIKSNSMYNYYNEVSYGRIYIAGRVNSVWYNASRIEAYYGGNQEQNISVLVEEAVNKSNGDINYSDYDLDGDGFVDHLIVVHAGQDDAADTIGEGPAIWSQRFQINPLSVDGVQVKYYITVSEFSPMGVFAHEFGHDLKGANNQVLPDLYDTKGIQTHSGVGNWDLMASGAWLPAGKGTNPAHMSAWSKVMKGWIEPTVISNPGNHKILYSANQTNNFPKVYEVDINTFRYFLIENRYSRDFDENIPGNGTLIWHVDNIVTNQDNASHKMVDLEEAGQNVTQLTLDLLTYSGGSGDPWPFCNSGSCINNFFNESSPSSKDYGNVQTSIGVLNISNKGPLMSAVFIPSNYSGNTKVIRVYNFGEGNLDVTSITSSDLSHLNATPTSFTVGPESYKNVTVSVYGIFNSGANRYNLTFVSNDASSPTKIPVVVIKNQTVFGYYGIQSVFQDQNVSNLTISSLNETYSNNTLRIFEFKIKNTGDTILNNVNWTFYTGIGNILGNNLISLEPDKEAFVFIAYNYSQSGEFTTNATAKNNSIQDSELLQVNVPSFGSSGIDVYGLNVLNSSAAKRLFEFKINNTLSTSLNNVNWTFDTKDENIINSTSNVVLPSFTQMFVFVEYNFTVTPGSGGEYFNTNVTGRNSTLTDSQNLTLFVQ